MQVLSSVLLGNAYPIVAAPTRQILLSVPSEGTNVEHMAGQLEVTHQNGVVF
jgi:hypothetical protein